jgi:pimeloyl-ACP methyl ester carboxylesterase
MGPEISSARRPIPRRAFLGAATAAGAGLAAGAGRAESAAAAATTSAAAPSRGKTILVAHGAWSAGWVWKKMHPLMTAAGHRLITPTQTGLGEREHLATPNVDLETHIQDLLGVIKHEELNDFVLLGHSYGGMVATGVADRVPERISQLIYMDAFVPRDGQSLLDLQGPDASRAMRERVKAGDGWRVQPNPPPPDTPPDDLKWIQAHRMPQPLKCFDTPVRLENGDAKMPRAYIYCLRRSAADPFKPFAERAKKEHWDYREIDASHSPHVTAPEALAALLNSIMAKKSA